MCQEQGRDHALYISHVTDERTEQNQLELKNINRRKLTPPVMAHNPDPSSRKNILRYRINGLQKEGSGGRGQDGDDGG